MGSSDLILESYKHADDALRLRQSKIGCVLVLILIPAGLILDYFVYPEQLFDFVVWRLLAVVTIGIILAIHYTKNAIHYIKVLTFLWLTVTLLMLCYMINELGGSSSSYYEGITLLIVAIGILLPLTVKEVFLFCSSALILYLIACLYDPVSTIETKIFFNNLYFLSLASIISLTAVHFNTKRRFNEFCLNRRLDKQNKKLAELDRLKSEFFANISHELRTPLTLILAPVQDLIQDKSLSQGAASQLKMVRDNALRLLKLVNDILDIIRLEEGKTELKKEPVDITRMLDGLIDSVIHLAALKEIHIKKLIHERVVVAGDPRALEKVFLNTLMNAIKFTNPAGEITIQSEISLEDRSVTIKIVDNGIGISTVDLPHIFYRFHQADGSSTKKQQGTGLGLSLAKELTERQGGCIGINSVLGSGTTVLITLPLLDTDSLIEAPIFNASVDDPLERLHRQAELSSSFIAPREPASPVVDECDDRPTLLLVDDEPDMRHYLMDMLNDDYRIYYAEDGAKGLALAQEHAPEIILLDLMLPEINGLEVCRRIKENRALSHTKIMLLTARIDEAAKIKALKFGADDFLTKPFSSVEVKTRLKNLYQTALLQKNIQQRNRELEVALKHLKQTQATLINSEKLNALGKLSAGLMHEINNPLNYAMTALHIAINDERFHSNPELLEILQDIDEGMNRICTIIADLRAFAHPSEADLQHSFDFQSAVESAIRFTSHEIEGVNVLRNLSPESWVRGAQSHVVQVLINLISNAALAISVTSERRGEIKIYTNRSGDRLKISVRDNGIGISPEVLPQVFDPFFTTRDVGAGVGVGLSISHTIVKQHGGELTVRSEEGEWTEFSFDLPLR